MKKLMLTAAIVCAAVMSYGAAVVWNAGPITRFDDSTANKNVTGYLFEIAAADYATYSAMDAETLSKAVYADFKDSLGSPVNSGTASKKGALSLEGIEATELKVNLHGDVANRLVVGFRGAELHEVMIVVQDLSRIVEDTPFGGLDNLLQRHVGVFRAFDGGVQVVDIALQVFPMVEANRLLADDGLQSVCLIRQLNELVFHDDYVVMN